MNSRQAVESKAIWPVCELTSPVGVTLQMFVVPLTITADLRGIWSCLRQLGSSPTFGRPSTCTAEQAVGHLGQDLDVVQWTRLRLLPECPTILIHLLNSPDSQSAIGERRGL